MSHTKFQNDAYQFLTSYKRCNFPNTQDGTWHDRHYGHIFAKHDAINNFLIPNSDAFSIIPNGDSYCLRIANHHSFSLHTDWNHLNSSQILCINYFYSFLFDIEKLGQFSHLLGIEATPVHGEFEHNPGDDSSIDFVVHFDDSTSLFCEIKYSENDFGKADTKEYGEDFYLERKTKFYSNVCIDNQSYFKHYQIVRNVTLAVNGNHTLFLYPAHNNSASHNLQKGLKAIKNKDDFNIHTLTWEELLKAIPNSKVQSKYFPYM